MSWHSCHLSTFNYLVKAWTSQKRLFEKKPQKVTCDILKIHLLGTMNVHTQYCANPFTSLSIIKFKFLLAEESETVGVSFQTGRRERQLHTSCSFTSCTEHQYTKNTVFEHVCVSACVCARGSIMAWDNDESVSGGRPARASPRCDLITRSPE